jgi:hypothetical protein
MNPYPELPVVEREKGIYVVDNPDIPDTPEPVKARELRRNSANIDEQIGALTAQNENDLSMGLEDAGRAGDTAIRHQPT